MLDNTEKIKEYNFCDLLKVFKDHENLDENIIIKEFNLALDENPQTALKILFWYRTRFSNSIYIFRILIKFAYTLLPEVIERNIWCLTTFCDDLDIVSIVSTTPISKSLIRFIRSEAKRGKKYSNNLLNLVGLPVKNYVNKHTYKSKIKNALDNNDLLSNILEDFDLAAIS